MKTKTKFELRRKFVLFWKKHQFKVVVSLCLITLLILWLVNRMNKTIGTWSLHYNYTPELKKSVKYVYDSKGELECRRVLENIFMVPFPNQRPAFLMNSVTGKPLEIDCCNLDLKLGVEYNGKQHYEYVPRMHKNYESFRLQQYRDEMKIKLCKENNFNLIIVPYTVAIDSIELFLIDHLTRLGYL